MLDSQKIMEMAKQNNGIVTSAMVTAAGISRGTLKHLTDTGRLEKASRGVYSLPEQWDDEFVNLQTRFKRGIFALETALFLCGLTDRTPAKFRMVFPETYNLAGPKREGVLCSGAKEPYYSLGLAELKTPAGNPVYGYCAERTLCDILKLRNHTDVQIISGAFKSYASRKEKDIPRLSEYARMLGVEKKLRSYLEVLL